MTEPESTPDAAETAPDAAETPIAPSASTVPSEGAPLEGAADPLDGADPAVAAAPPTTAAEGGSIAEWLFATKALATARAGAAERHPTKTARLAQARKALAFGDAILDPANPPREGAGPGLAVTLYRDALGWLLASQTPEAEVLPVERAVAALDEDAARTFTGGAASLDDLRALAAWDIVKQGHFDDEALFTHARQTKRFVRNTAEHVSEAERTIAHLKVRRASRVTGTLIVLSAVVAAMVMLVTVVRRKPDLAKGAPWRASSSADTCHPEKRQCTGTDTAIFFHTKEDDSPWVEIDLGKPTEFSRTEIINRLDCCTDRPLPLVIEVSNDAKTWKEVAKRTESFRTWNASFPKQTARYVRARVGRKSVLHLEGFSVR